MFYIYVKQDGMYTTQDILITDEFSKDLRIYWYFIDSFEEWCDAIAFCYKNLFDFNCSEIKVKLEDEYILTKEDVKNIIPEYFIL